MSTIKTTTLSNVAGTSSVPVNTVINGSAKAWVNFNGTGTVAINASFNVSSITDNGTGDYTANFTTAMTDAYYVPSGACQEGTSGGAGDMYLAIYESATNPATTSIRVNTRYGTSSLYDCVGVYVVVFR